MTEHLTDLMHDTAQDLDIPPVPATAVLTRGRARVRRRRAGLGIGAVAALIAVGAVVQATALRPDETVVLDAASAPQASDWAVAQGSTIHLGTGATATVPGQVQAMYYTSAGTLVRVGTSPHIDNPDPYSSYWLVRRDGSLSDLKLKLDSVAPGTDPALPYLAYTEPGTDDSHWTLVIRDVRNGKITREIPFDRQTPYGAWPTPPVSLAGDHVYVGAGRTLLDIAWRTGEIGATGVPSHLPAVRGGFDVSDERNAIVAVPSGEIAYQSPDPNLYPSLSPDGSHASFSPMQTTGDKRLLGGYADAPIRTIKIVNLDTGKVQTTVPEYGAYGWSADGDLLRVDGRRVQACDPDTMRCVWTEVVLDGDGPIKISGNSYES
jgi:hypothetical protein